ncbi:hypothetical protein TEA_029217 [Camellia sinensis var. sinensis]|uniref:OTU domain-containing protein n=1 Tax=Camellia sinensis var. sinensis TaxID=542762 RepID=A0A4S4EYT6_CAMSN|nr:hypothetical protein TEA_029217 [Camellia sinensis var. sinensis]
MITHEQDPDVVWWGLQLFDSDPFPNCGYYGNITQNNAEYYHDQYFKEDHYDVGCGNVENDEFITHAFQELSQLSVAEPPGSSDEGVTEYLQAPFYSHDWLGQSMENYSYGIDVFKNARHHNGHEETDDTGPSSSCSSPGGKSNCGEEWSYSLELMDEHAFDGEVGKRLNEMVPIPTLLMITHEQDPDVVWWGLQLFDSDPFPNCGYYGNITQNNAEYYHDQYFKEDHYDVGCGNVENDEFITHAFQELSQLSVAEQPGSSDEGVTEYLQAPFYSHDWLGQSMENYSYGIDVFKNASFIKRVEEEDNRIQRTGGDAKSDRIIISREESRTSKRRHSPSQDPDVVWWGLQLFDSDPFPNCGYYGNITQNNAEYYHDQYFKEDHYDVGCGNVENDEFITHAFQELSQLSVAEQPGSSDEGVTEYLQAPFYSHDWLGQSMENYSYGIDVFKNARHHNGHEETDDTGPSSSCSSPGGKSNCGEEWSYSLELMDEHAFDGEVGKRLNEMVPIPHVPRTNGEIPSVDEATLDHQRLLDRLQLYDLVEFKVHGDGNCQFRALSDQFYRSPEHHKFVRQQIVNQLESCPEIYEGYVPMAYGDYLKKMSKNGEWGDHVTLQAAADSVWFCNFIFSFLFIINIGLLYGMKIFVITSFKDTCYIEIIPNVQRSKRVVMKYEEKLKKKEYGKQDEEEINNGIGEEMRILKGSGKPYINLCNLC